MGLTVSVKKRVNGFSLDTTWEIGNELAGLFHKLGDETLFELDDAKAARVRNCPDPGDSFSFLILQE
mgnify:CR=1 FL=1